MKKGDWVKYHYTDTFLGRRYAYCRVLAVKKNFPSKHITSVWGYWDDDVNYANNQYHKNINRRTDDPRKEGMGYMLINECIKVKEREIVMEML